MEGAFIMRRTIAIRIIYICMCTLLLAFVARPSIAQDADIESMLTFEVEHTGTMPTGWNAVQDGTVAVDDEMVYEGDWAVRLQRDAGAANTFSAINKGFPVDFTGEWVELSGRLRSEDVTEFVGLWMRLDGPAGPVAFDNMQSRQIRGTTDWTEYSVRLPFNPAAEHIVIGALLVGEGTLWVDDLDLRVDDRPLSEVPRVVREPTVLETDTEFDAGSGFAAELLTAAPLTATQIDNLAMLGKVWGFLKYHHPRVASGELHWDYELFRVLPDVLEAGDADARNAALAAWTDEVGVPDSCDPCAEPPMDPHLMPDLDWIADDRQIGEELSIALQAVRQNRFAANAQFFVSPHAGVGNPSFDNELPYDEFDLPDAGYRLLALYRYWNMVEYWFPYRDLIEDDWDGVLREFVLRLVEAESAEAYRRQLLYLIARLEDTHANLWSALDVRPPKGSCYWPFAVQFVEERLTVTDLTARARSEEAGIQVGDVIESIDGTTIEELVEAWSPLYAASNERTRRRDIARQLPRGTCGETTLVVHRPGSELTLTVARYDDVLQFRPTYDRPGETFQMLSPEVAYLKIGTARAADVDDYMERTRGTAGLAIDIRNYPSDFLVFELGARLVREPTEFVRFTRADLRNPGAFLWAQPLTLQPAAPAYDGKVVVLVNENTLSSAEYHAMAFRPGPNAVVIGSQTAAADGNVSRLVLPGGVGTMFTGLGVFYPDKTPTQQIGIVPDIHAEPTAEGVRTGRDEVLEGALRHILGPDADEDEVRRMALRPAAAN